jgi:hypothetical protein
LRIAASTMADTADTADTGAGGGAADRRRASEREVPVPGFNEITLEQAEKRLRRLSPEKLRRVRAYELATQKRQSVLAAIDRLLEVPF